MPRALIIDDEFDARADLREMLTAHPEIEIVGEAATLAAARERLARDDYDLVFLDIQLFGGSGFELVPEVSPQAAIIFVTAHNQHALRAFEVNALDYLLKPVRRERLAASLRRIETRRNDPASPDLPPATALRIDDTVHLNCGARSRFVRVADISWIEAEENYCRIELATGTQYLVRRTLKSWEDALPPSAFLRIHRTSLVNLEHVTGYERSGLRSIALTLTGVAAPVVVSRVATPEVRARLRNRFPEM
jgi:two-component system LytT family response regulator